MSGHPEHCQAELSDRLKYHHNRKDQHELLLVHNNLHRLLQSKTNSRLLGFLLLGRQNKLATHFHVTNLIGLGYLVVMLVLL